MSMRIARVEAFVYRAPIVTPVANAFGTMANRPALFVRVSAADGAYGWGEVFCNFPQVGAEHRARLIAGIHAPLLENGEFEDALVLRRFIEARTRRMAIQCGEPGPFAQIAGGLEQAAWDMAARRAGRPLWQVLDDTGRGVARVRVYASGIGPGEVASTAAARQRDGYRAFKLKVGFGPAVDVANLAAMREAVGDEAVVMVDANQAWSPDEAAARIAELAPARPLWVEEPLAADEPAAEWRALARDTGMALAAGENLRGEAAFREAIDGGFLRFVQPDIGKWGGLAGGRAVARHAAARGVDFCPHWLAGGIGLAGSMHLRAALGEGGYVEVDANPNPLREEVCDWRVVDGMVDLPSTPGLGIEPDLARLARFAVKVQA
ncbi:MAG: mandelate racemase/muconate lactonizing enzyme family protein [Burkholderiales bacterium]|nr:mandelate racemase/muconate lactonizing enzyme family protein [Burkholderiales bacterium]